MKINPQLGLAAMTVRYQKLLDRIPHPAWLGTDQGEIIMVNQQWHEHFGQASSEGFAKSVTSLSLKPFLQILRIEERDQFSQQWAAAKKSQRSLEIKLQLPGLAGNWDWFQVELEPDSDELEQRIWIGTAIRLGGEVALSGQQQSFQFLEAILDHASDGIVACNAVGKLVLFNRMAQIFHALPPEPISPEEWANYYDLYNQDGTEVLSKSEIPLFRALQGEAVVSQEMMIKSKVGGDRSLMAATGTAIYSPTGEKLGAVTLMRDITDYRQAMITLQQSERLSIALQVAKSGAWNWDLVNHKIFWTRECEILFDYEPGTMQPIYSEWLQRVHPDDRQHAETALQGAIDQVLPEYRCEYRIVHRNGQIRWIDAIGELYTDEQGHARLSGLVHDITERKQDEEALHRNEEFTRRILVSNQDCIKVLDLEGHLLYMNDNGQALLEIDDFATISQNQWPEFWRGDEAKIAEEAFATAKAGGTGKFEGYCATVKGTPKWWEVIVTSVLDTHGHVEQILSVSRDITERKQMMIALQTSEELFRHTFEHTPVGFAHVQLDGRLSRVNQKFCEIVGYSSEELLTTTFQQITEPADLAKDLALIEQLLNDEIREYTLEKRYVHKQGHHVWVSLTVSIVREIGTPQYFLSVIKDITERKHLELLNQVQTADLQRLNNALMLTQQRLNIQNEELDSFVHMVSHDLKAPLRSIANLSEWIEEDLNGRISEDNQQQFQLLRQRVSRMDALVDGLLRYSRVGRQELPIEPVDVAQLLAETIDSLDPPARFKIEILSPLPTLNTKKILLGQIFANLLSNAIKHHHRAAGHIEISAEDKGDHYQFSIADDGPGIPSGKGRERIFEIFQTLQPHPGSTNTGIGLALVKKIVEGEGGRLWLEENNKEGSCFCFTWLQIDSN